MKMTVNLLTEMCCCVDSRDPGKATQYIKQAQRKSQTGRTTTVYDIFKCYSFS